MVLPLPNHRALPYGQVGEEATPNILRYRAEVERAMNVVQAALQQVDSQLTNAKVVTYVYTVTDDAGDGTIEGDANATNYTGQPGAVGVKAFVDTNYVTFFAHKDVLYLYGGPRPVQIGVSTAYISVAGDYSLFGSDPTLYLPLTGGTMTGPLILNAKPVQDLEASTKNYVGVSQFDPTVAYLKDDLVGYEASVYFSIDDHAPNAWDISQWRSIAAVVGRAINLSYNWTTTITSQVPDGGYGVNNADVTLATEVRMSTNTRTGFDVAGFIQVLDASDVLGFEEETGGAEWNYYSVTGPPVLVVALPNYFLIPVAYIANNGTPENNRNGVVSVIYNPASRLPTGGTTRQSLVKASDGDYDTEWTDLTEADISDLDRMRFKTPYSFGPLYEKNDAVLDEGWTMVANKQTSDRAAIIPIEPAFYVYTGTISETTANAKQVIFGNRYEWVNQPAYLSGYRLYLFAGNRYTVYTIVDPLGVGEVNQITSFTAQNSGWVEFGLTPKLYPVGTVMDVVVVVAEPDVTPVITTLSYNYITANNEAVPIAGEITHANRNLDNIWISKTDNNLVDQSAFLATLSIGDTIDNGDFEWAVQTVTDLGTYISVGVAPAQQASPNGVRNFDFHTVTATPISYGLDVDFWLTSSFNVQGLLGIDIPYADITPDNTAYGVDLLIQDVSSSPDWDILAPSSEGSGGGSGGGGDGSAVTFGDTFPPAAVAGAQHYMTAAPVGMMVLYDDGDSIQWVQQNGGALTETAVPTVIVEADASAGWQVWGDTLIQWGTDGLTDSNGLIVVTFEQPFKDITYTILGSVAVGGAVASKDRTVNRGDLTTTAANLLASVDGVASNGVNVVWMAVGEAPDDMKQPKEVPTVIGTGGGGGGASVTMGDTFPLTPEAGNLHYLTTDPVAMYIWYVDGTSDQWVQANGGTPYEAAAPTIIVEDSTGTESGYQIVGDILIQWGEDTGQLAGTTYNFPVAYASRPQMAATTRSGTDSDNVSLIGTATTYAIYTNVAGRNCSWIAIGLALEADRLPKEVVGGGGGGGASVTTGPTFPVAPTVGDMHYMTVEPVGLAVYYEDVDGFQWVQTNGGTTAGEPVTIVEDDVTAGHIVVGDVLMQWGFTTADGAGVAETFPIAYIGASPRVTVACNSGTLGNVVSVDSLGITGFTAYGANAAGAGTTVGCHWMVMGEAPDDLKQPKTVKNVGGGGSAWEQHVSDANSADMGTTGAYQEVTGVTGWVSTSSGDNLGTWLDNNSRWTCIKPGTYKITMNSRWQRTDVAGGWSTPTGAILVDGAFPAVATWICYHDAGNKWGSTALSLIVEAVEGTVVALGVYVVSGTSLMCNSPITIIERLGD